MSEIILDSVIDSIKLLPFLFLTYLFMEWLEHKTGAAARKRIRTAGKFGPVWGGLLGVIPQCGFSAAASSLFAGRVITVGTLIAVYLSTSDEMFPIMISNAVPVVTIVKILTCKAVIGILSGLVLEYVYTHILKKQEPDVDIHEICEEERCHCEHGVISSAAFHTLKVFVYIFLISLVLNIGYVYRGRLTSMMSNTRQKNYRKKNVFQITSKIYPILFILGLVMMFTTEHIASGYIVFSVIGALGGYGTVRYFSPEYIEKLKASKWLNNSQRLVVFGELYLKFKYIGIFLELLILISIIITTLICFNLNNLIEMYRMIIAYIIIIPMIVFCITYKNLIISKKNVKNQNCIYKLGITKKYQKKFIKEETLIMYGILFILPMTYMISTLGRFYVYDGISILIIAFIIGYFILNLLISMYISYKVTTQFFRGV